MASNIIKFPRARPRRKRLTDVLVDRITSLDTHVDLGHVPFTCAECGSTSSFDFSGLIFRQVTFYCASCGHGYRVSNPMFADQEVRVRIVSSKSQG